MSSTVYYDDLIRDYLLFRGFTATLKAFEAELKADKDKGFRVDKVVDQLCSYIASYDLASLRDAWSHLDQRVFARLEHQFAGTVRKLEGGLLKMYAVNTVQTSRADKLLEFFDRMSPELQNQPEWKEWFVLPFVKNPEENPVFSMYFTRQWQDTMLVSLHNFLSVIFQCMPLPTLLSYAEEQSKMSSLIEENEALRQKILCFQTRGGGGGGSEPSYVSSDVDNVESEANELMDDFCVIAQQEPQPSDSQQGKSIRSIIRNISSGLPTSPILGRKQQQPQLSYPSAAAGGRSAAAAEDNSATTGKYVIQRAKPRTGSLPPSRTRVFSETEATAKSQTAHSLTKDDTGPVHRAKGDQAQKPRPRSATVAKGKSEPGSDGGSGSGSGSTAVRMGGGEGSPKSGGGGGAAVAPFRLLGQDGYHEHHAAITHCKFNASGSVIASADVNGVVKIWSPNNPSPLTLATVAAKSSVLALEWAGKMERLLLMGNRSGTIRLYDIKEKKSLCEVPLEQSGSYREQRVTCLTCCPVDSAFVCCSMGIPKVPFAGLGSESAASAFSPEGRISIWDMKQMKPKKTLNLEPTTAIGNCCVFNHNGQLLLVGATDGWIRLFDMRCEEGIAMWQAHRGNAYSVQFSADETSCYSLGEDGKFIQWNVNKTGEKMSSAVLHDRAAGPFCGAAATGHSYSGGAAAAAKYSPTGKLFAADSEGKHLLTCAPNGGIIYAVRSDEDPQVVLTLGGHSSPVVTVDWAAATDCGMCVTASLDGEIRISTLLPK